MSEVVEELTEEQKYALLLDRSARAALRAAPTLAHYVRSLAVDGEGERGETLPEWSAPMRLSPTDAVDEMYAQLLNWVGFWSETLEVAPPATAVVAWANSREPQGFRAGTTPEGARLLVNLQTMWLLLRADQLAGYEAAAAYQLDVAEIVWRVKGEYPMSPGRPHTVSAHPCPVCDERSVRATWMSEDPRDVVVRCGHCGHEVEMGATLSRLPFWLGERVRTEAFDVGNPEHVELWAARERNRKKQEDR